MPLKDMDTSSRTSEEDWFHASQHWADIRKFCQSFDGPRDLALVSVYDASQKVYSQWVNNDYASAAVDIRTDPTHDMSSRHGFFTVLTLLMSLAAYGISILAPPCSLFIYMSSSQHKRCDGHEEGDTSQYLVRLANLLAENTAVAIKAQLKFRSDTFMVAEQPKGSWMFKTMVWQQLLEGFFLKRTLTYQGLFGARIEKGTHLWHNLSDDTLLARKMTKANRDKFRKRLARKGIDPEACYRKKNGSVSGTKELAKTSVYPKKFIKALFNQWQACL